MPLDAARDAVIVMQAQVISALAAENTRLTGQVHDLAARVERLGRLASRNSGNSSMPPSADDLPGRTPPRRKPSAGGKRKPGKQPGPPGAHLAWSEHPRFVRLVRDLLAEDVAAGRLQTPVPLDDLAYTAVRIVESYVHRAAITGDEPDADRAARVLHALLR